MKNKKRSYEDYREFVSKLLLVYTIKMGQLEDEELTTSLKPLEEDLQILMADDISIDIEFEKVKESFEL